MKIRYLPIEDRQISNLRVLRHTADKNVIIAILESILKRPYYTLQILWEYRKWFSECSEQELKEHPSLTCGLAQIYIMSGELEKAYELIEALPEDSRYKVMSQITVPGISTDQFIKNVRTIRDKGWNVGSLTLTAGRPSVINGIWDMTALGEESLPDDFAGETLLKTLYPESFNYIMEIIRAERLYWRNDCYNALIALVGTIPFLKEKHDMRLLFAALTLEMYILMLNGQATSSVPLMENLKAQIQKAGLEEYMPNIDALEAWAAMYDGDYVKVASWLREGAPDEHSKFCMLDLFRYMVNIRAYIIQGKHMAVTSLAGRLMPLLKKGNRYMDSCELYILWAISDHADGRAEEALDKIGFALGLAEKYGYDRLLADDGKRVFELLKLYKSRRGGTEYLAKVIKLAEETATLHPKYLKSQLPKRPALTETEMKVLRLLAVNYSNKEISEHFGIAVDTVKQHCKHIYIKLDSSSRRNAVATAVELGLIEPQQSGKTIII